MRAPEFWNKAPGTLSAILAPLSVVYRIGGSLRGFFAQPWRSPIPVICVGGIVAGGSGKTPASLALAEFLNRQGVAAHFIASGYRGSFAKSAPARRIDPLRHTAAEAGDEALLLAMAAPTWVCRDRREAARAAFEAGADLIVMDDGYQDPSLIKDLSILVVDGAYGFGNRKILPSGPLRETVAAGLGRADAVILVGENESGVTASIPAAIPLLRAKLTPGPEAEDFSGQQIVAFAGIGDPPKFFRMLEELGCKLRGKFAFPDHHAFTPKDMAKLINEAETFGAFLVTTAKDMVRVPEDQRSKVRVLSVRLAFRDETALARLIAPLLPKRAS